MSYHPDPFNRWGPHLGPGLVEVLLLSSFLDGHSAGKPTLIALALCLAFHVCILKVVGMIRLDLSAAGIRSRSIGTTIDVAWSDVEAVAFGGGGNGLVLKAPLATRMSRLTAALSSLQRDGVYVSGETSRSWLAQKRWLSLRIYTRPIKKGDLAAQIDGFAPRLRARAAREAWLHPAAERSPPQTAALLKFAASMIGTIGVTVALIRWNENVLLFIVFVLAALSFFYYAAHAIHVAVASLIRRDYTKAAVSLALGIPAYMFIYLVVGGIVDGVRHPKGDHPPSARRPAAPAGQLDPKGAHPLATGGAPPPR